MPHPSTLWFLAINSNTADPYGLCGMSSIDYIHGVADHSILLASNYRGRGLGTQIRVILLDFAFMNMRMHRVNSRPLTDNLATKKMNEAMGFVHEGDMREAAYIDGKRIAVEMWSLLGSEWAAQRATWHGKVL